jgi:hypothetical protein
VTFVRIAELSVDLGLNLYEPKMLSASFHKFQHIQFGKVGIAIPTAKKRCRCKLAVADCCGGGVIRLGVGVAVIAGLGQEQLSQVVRHCCF